MSDTTQTVEPEVRRISSCTGCSQALPLRQAAAGEQAVGWNCAGCGATFLAVLDEAADATSHRNVRVSPKLFAEVQSQSIPQGMMRFLENVPNHDVGDNRRRQKRYAVNIKAAALPVDERMSPTGEGFLAMTFNISQSGLALVHTRAVNDKLLLIQLDDKQHTQVVLEVIRSRHAGRFYDVAGRFIRRFGTMAAST
ncbi:MAG: PilZ domain-containing protein [Pirellulales bacterium]|nr:PilZ domain-containing protein [Pirellulales bacterium]